MTTELTTLEIENASEQALQYAAMLVHSKPLILDTETTGLDGRTRIVDICLMEIDGTVVFETLVDPEVPIPPDVSRIHGITDETIKDAGVPTWPTIAPLFSEIITGRYLVSWNIGFDLRLISQMDDFYHLLQATCGGRNVIPADAMTIYSDYYGEWDEFHGNFRWQKLTKAAADMGIEFDPDAAHRAAYDCDLARQVLLAMNDYFVICSFLDSNVRKLAILRKREAEAKAMLAELKSKFVQSQEYQHWMSLLTEIRGGLDTIDQDVRQGAVDAYQHTQNKHPHTAVSIQMTTEVNYDRLQAIAWCRENLHRALQLDDKYFDKHAKAVSETAPIDFVEITKVPKAAIASDLSAYLPIEMEEPA